ncbi:chemotaxis protein CheX [Alkaliphilus sp. B6464]|uniref:chemotaxis protein CheX n=1 Tax=Alkaliphilus sp. B6464 TaxID=2731219 RepID=UPI001BA4C0A6|nr:chemotaxis protein CheX [Alkaliphilus sp. B6464]QUH22151.1 chemotaxis protein CheX [Alkaliphilus sp. B6464]
MKVEHINPFVKASTDILSQMAGLTCKLGKIYIKNETFNAPDVSILIGITGDLKGRAVLNMNKLLGLKIASHMMGGIDIQAFDEISRSALAEIGNMIMGNSATHLSSEGTIIDITPPTIIFGDSLLIHTSDSKPITIPLESQHGKIELDIAVS